MKINEGLHITKAEDASQEWRDKHQKTKTTTELEVDEAKKLLKDTKETFISKLEELVIELAKTPMNNVSEELRTLAEQRKQARSKSLLREEKDGGR